MDAKGTTRRRTAFARLLTSGAVLLLFVLLVTPGDAAPGSRVVSPATTIALQQAMATNVVALGGGYGKVHCPDWWWPRSPCKPPWPPYWPPGPPYWAPGPPYWPPGPPYWAPGPPYWVPRPPIWSGWWW